MVFSQKLVSEHVVLGMGACLTALETEVHGMGTALTQMYKLPLHSPNNVPQLCPGGTQL